MTEGATLHTFLLYILKSGTKWEWNTIVNRVHEHFNNLFIRGIVNRISSTYL